MPFARIVFYLRHFLFVIPIAFVSNVYAENTQRFDGNYKLVNAQGFSKHFLPVNCIPMTISGLNELDSRHLTCDYVEEQQNPNRRCPLDIYIAGIRTKEVILISQFPGISYSNSWIKLPDRTGQTDTCDDESLFVCNLLVKSALNYVKKIHQSSENFVSQETVKGTFNRAFVSIQKEPRGLTLINRGVEFWSNGSDSPDKMNDYDVSCVYEKK